MYVGYVGYVGEIRELIVETPDLGMDWDFPVNWSGCCRGIGDEVDDVQPAACPPQSPLTCKQRLAYGQVVGDVFKAIADPTRRVILDELQERSGQTLFELCVRLTTKHGLGSSRQAISQHLAVLESAGLVITRRQGRYKYHDLDTTPLRTIVERWQIGH